MDCRSRFRALVSGDRVDRIPLFEEEIRPEVLECWYRQGLSRDIDGNRYRDYFGADRWEYIYIWLEPRPGPLSRPCDFTRIMEGYRHDVPEFLQPRYWENKAREYENRDFPLGLMGWRGILLPLLSREREWESFQEVMWALYDYPELVKSVLCSARDCFMEVVRLASRFLAFDFGIIAEPIAAPAGPVISPSMFREFALPHHRDIAACFREHGIGTVIFRSFENVGPLLPAVAESGADGLWINQCGSAIDYVQVRRQYPDFLLIGGINARVLLRDESAIEREVMRVVPPLLQAGRYLPGLDDRPRENVPFHNYAYYRRLLQEAAGTAPLQARYRDAH